MQDFKGAKPGDQSVQGPEGRDIPGTGCTTQRQPCDGGQGQGRDLGLEPRFGAKRRIGEGDLVARVDQGGGQIDDMTSRAAAGRLDDLKNTHASRSPTMVQFCNCKPSSENVKIVFLADRRLDDLARAARRLALGQGVDVFHAGFDLTPDGVLTIQEGGVVEHDEEL